MRVLSRLNGSLCKLLNICRKVVWVQIALNDKDDGVWRLKNMHNKNSGSGKTASLLLFFSNFIEAFFISLGQRALNCGFCVEERGVGGDGACQV